MLRKILTLSLAWQCPLYRAYTRLRRATVHPSVVMNGRPLVRCVRGGTLVISVIIFASTDTLGQPARDSYLDPPAVVLSQDLFRLSIAPNTANLWNYDFTWNSRSGMVYDLVSSTDLSTHPADWPTWDGRSGIPPSGTGINSLTNIPGDGPRRFFAIQEQGAIVSLAFVGDSTTADAGTAGNQPYGMSGTGVRITAAWANAVSWALGREIPVVIDTVANPARYAFAAGGQKSDHVLSIQIPRILASETKPSHVVWKIGTNDVSQNYPIALSESNIRTGIAALKAAGMESILTTINPCREGSRKEAGVFVFNNLLATIAAETGSIFVDSRALMESAPGTEFVGCLYDGVHQWEQTAYAMAADFVDQVGTRFGPAFPDFFDMGPLLHNQADIVSAPPPSQTTSQSSVKRNDGIAGDFYRCEVSSSPVLVIGSGNSGVSYTPVGEETTDTLAIHQRTVHNNATFSNGGLPRITVGVLNNGRKFIEVRAEMNSNKPLTTAAEVVMAIAADSEASMLVTASATGDGTGKVEPGTAWENWNLRNTAASINPPAGSWVRAICEITNRSAMRYLFLRLSRSAPANATLRSISAATPGSTILIPPRRWVIATPWHQIGEGETGWSARIAFGQEKGIYDIGRFGIQVYEP